MSDQIEKNKHQEIINWTLPGLTTYYRDSNLDDNIIGKYEVGKIFRSKTFVDVSNLGSKPTSNCRFIFASNKAAPLFKINPATAKWGLHTINCNSCFKVLDVYKYDGIVQIFLLHIPYKGIDFFSNSILQLGNQNIEKQIIEKARKNLQQKIKSETVSALQEKEWLHRTSFPIGLDNKNEFFNLEVSEPIMEMAKPMYSAIKKMTNDLTDLNEAPEKKLISSLSKDKKENDNKNLELNKKKSVSIFRKIFGKSRKKNIEPKIQEKETTTFTATTMSKAELEKMKVGDIISLGGNAEDKVNYVPKWIEAQESPFKVQVFDCREYAINMVSTTKNPSIVSKFTELRNSNGTEFIGKFPKNGTKAEVDLNFNTRGKQFSDGILFKAKRMEEKWDIYKYANFIFFVRSWTGDLIYFCNYIPTQTGFRVDLLVLDDTKIDEKDPFFEFRVVEFLIHSHVLGHQFPHPIPKSVKDNPEGILGYSYSMFGNRGYFGKYD